MSKDLFLELREKEQLEQTYKDRNNLYNNIINESKQSSKIKTIKTKQNDKF